MEELSNIEKRVLIALGAIGEKATPEEIRARAGFDEMVQVMNGSSWLQAKGLVRHEETLRTFVAATKEGRAFADRGLPERRAVDAIRAEGGAITLDALRASGALAADEVNVATGWLKRKGLATIEKAPDGATVLRLTSQSDAQGVDERLLQHLANASELPVEDVDAKGLELLLGRQNLVRKRDEITRVIHLTTKGRVQLEKGVEVKEDVSQITSELIGTGKWRDVNLRAYDVTAFAPVASGGKKHPLRQVIDRIRRIFLDMGFEEIEGPYARSAFWNMDVLFTPQDHPAREMQDTFYLSRPARAPLGREPLKDKVKAIHENGGGTGSAGWRNPWSEDVAAQMLLRTHTTVDTINYLRNHPDPPVKVFSVDRVFRNEAIDATHLPEFHQVEGIVMEEGANLRMLIGLLREFYKKMGASDVRVRPAYFPYTEPSLEVEVFYNNKWMELGGAGIFRPEVTAAVGVKHPVLAWGLGLERIAMMTLGLKDVRDLYVSDVEWLRNAPIVE